MRTPLRERPHQLPALVLVLLAGGVLAGCGGDDSQRVELTDLQPPPLVGSAENVTFTMNDGGVWVGIDSQTPDSIVADVVGQRVDVSCGPTRELDSDLATETVEWPEDEVEIRVFIPPVGGEVGYCGVAPAGEAPVVVAEVAELQQ